MKNDDAVRNFYSVFVPLKESIEPELEEDYISEDEIKDFLPPEEFIHPSKDYSDHEPVEIVLYPEDE